MKFLDILRTANSNLLRNKGRSFLTILAIFIGSFTIIMTTGINTGVNSYIDRQLESAGGRGYLEIMPKSTADQLSGLMSGSSEIMEYNANANGSDTAVITEEDLEKIRGVAGVESARAFGNVSSEYVTSGRTDRKFVITVNELPTNRINIDMAVGKIVDTTSSEPQITLLPNYATTLGYSSDEEIIGATVRIGVKNLADGEIREVEAIVSGVQNKSVISMGRSWINSALFDKLEDAAMDGMPQQYRNLAYFAMAEFDENLTDDEIQKMKDELSELGFIGMTVNDQVGMMKTFFDAITTVLTIFGVIALVAASIGIINTLFMAVQERTREIGLMKAVGLGGGKIFVMFSLEAIMLGFWGSALGIVIANIARLVANSLAEKTFLSELPGFTLIEFELANLVTITVIVMLIAFLAGSLPARRAARKDPIESLRYE